MPWDSGFLVNDRDRFEITLTVEGVYDYFCLPHEAGGMVGRIVVGRPGGPGALPFDDFAGRAGTREWLPIHAGTSHVPRCTFTNRLTARISGPH